MKEGTGLRIWRRRKERNAADVVESWLFARHDNPLQRVTEWLLTTDSWKFWLTSVLTVSTGVGLLVLLLIATD